MDCFKRRDGALWCEETPLADIAHAVGTPVYVYSSATIRRHFRVLREALASVQCVGEPLIAYAVKANSNLSVLNLLSSLGSGADTVSEGEIRRALAAGIPPRRIVVSGVGKTDAELAFALRAEVLQINVETESELRRLARIARELGVRAPFAIRVNPGRGAGGHEKITTGGATDKFGLTPAEALRLYGESAGAPSLAPQGLTCHIGSQITELDPLRSSFALMRRMTQELRAGGLDVPRLDLGGGLGVPYFDQPEPPSPGAFAQVAAEAVEGLDVELVLEPGRLIVGNAGVLVSRVINVHPRPDGGPRFLVLDAGMNDLMRPTLYGAFHDLQPLSEDPAPAKVSYDVVGPVCETGDTFARGRLLAELQADDLVAFMTAGAYGATMSNEYNSRRLAPEVLVDGGHWAVVRRRPTYEEMLEREPLAPWLNEAERPPR